MGIFSLSLVTSCAANVANKQSPAAFRLLIYVFNLCVHIIRLSQLPERFAQLLHGACNTHATHTHTLHSTVHTTQNLNKCVHIYSPD